MSSNGSSVTGCVGVAGPVARCEGGEEDNVLGVPCDFLYTREGMAEVKGEGKEEREGEWRGGWGIVGRRGKGEEGGSNR